MKINEQGFTERLSGPAGRVDPAADATQGTARSSSKQQGSGSSDSLQISNFASLLQSASSGVASSSSRASRLSQIAQLVSSGNYQIDPAKISSALVSEAMQPAVA